MPAPIPAKDGALLLEIDGTQVDVLIWLTGRTMTETLEATALEDHAPIFFGLRREMARLHQRSDAWLRHRISTASIGASRGCWARRRFGTGFGTILTL